VVAIANTDRTDQQTVINKALDALQTRYTIIDGFVSYPLFVYVLDRAPSYSEEVEPRSVWRSLPVPVSLYDRSLADLTLPARLHTPTGSSALIARGAFALSPTPGLRTRTVRLPKAIAGHTLLLATTLQDDGDLLPSSPVASLTFSSRASVRALVLRKGWQVDDWQRVGGATAAPANLYVAGYRWTKLVDFVGQRAYPEAYRQFTAGIAVATLPLSGQRFTGLTFRYLALSGTLRVWAAAVR
jgi:hypothetical protein